MRAEMRYRNKVRGGGEAQPVGCWLAAVSRLDFLCREVRIGVQGREGSLGNAYRCGTDRYQSGVAWKVGPH